MGQKANPIGLRLGIVRQSSSRWFATKDMPALLKEDELIRKYLKTRLGHAAIAQIDIERRPGKVTITVHTGRRGAWAAPRSRERKAITRGGCPCTRCGRTSTTPPAPRRRPTGPSASRSG